MVISHQMKCARVALFHGPGSITIWREMLTSHKQPNNSPFSDGAAWYPAVQSHRREPGYLYSVAHKHRKGWSLFEASFPPLMFYKIWAVRWAISSEFNFPIALQLGFLPCTFVEIWGFWLTCLVKRRQSHSTDLEKQTIGVVHLDVVIVKVHFTQTRSVCEVEVKTRELLHSRSLCHMLLLALWINVGFTAQGIHKHPC